MGIISTFDVTITRNVITHALHWPDDDEVDSESNPGCNRHYIDLRGMSWEDAENVYGLEDELIQRITSAEDVEAEYEVISEELYEMDEGLFGLDIGVASTVCALSALGCVPFSSCNAGTFGGSHHEGYPVVAVFIQKALAPYLGQMAVASEVGLEVQGGALIVFANKIENIRKFAALLIADEGRSAAQSLA